MSLETSDINYIVKKYFQVKLAFDWLSQAVMFL